MKKILAFAMVLVMVLCLTACASKEQAAADKWLEDYGAAQDDYFEAAYDLDVDAMEEAGAVMDDLEEEFDDIYDDLYDKDEEAAEQFLDDKIALHEEFLERADQWSEDMDLD